MNFLHRFFLFVILHAYTPILLAGPLQLVSTESDPDAFIQNCVNIINGDYCESATDLIIGGPDPLILQRFYSTNDPITSSQGSGWRILPQRFLVIGKDVQDKACSVGKDRFEWSSAFVGERSGGILPYSGWRNTNGTTKDPLRIDILNTALGMANTYAKEINGQTNHQNNQLQCKGETCELILGDGTKRIYQKVQELPSLLLGEELTPLMAEQVENPDYFLLSQEILPSGNQLFFSYNSAGHLILVEMKNKALSKTFSWIRFTYEFQGDECQIHIDTSDARTINYHLVLDNGVYRLTEIEGSNSIPISYEYNQFLVKKMLPEGRFTEIEYQDGKVKSLKGPHPQTGKSEVVHSFSYGKDFTDVFNAMGVKTRYIYDKRFQLTSIERYTDQNSLYRIEGKFWGKTKQNAGLLQAKTIGDGVGSVLSYRFFKYDKSGNVIEERLYGNLTGKHEASLQVSSDGLLINPDEEECNIKTFAYSSDGLNLLTKMGDCKGNQTLYIYEPETNHLIKKLIFDKGSIKKRTFQSYNEDGVCTKIIEDDGSREAESDIYGWSVTERHITEIKPKETLPGVGLPEIIEEKALDLKTKKEILIKKLVNAYDDQSNLISCSTYDANGEYAFIEKRTYNSLGQVTSTTDASGKEVSCTFDEIGNQTSVSIPCENKIITTIYNFIDLPIKITKITEEGEFSIYNAYDSMGRKICSTDRFGNSTFYEYDFFHRLTKIIHPEVLDENSKVICPTFSYSYDLFGNVVRFEDPKGFVTTKSYNLRGDPVKISYPDSSYEMFKYDPEGSLHRSLTRDQIITVYEYDYLGRSIYEEFSSAGENGVSSFLMSKTHQYNGFRCIYEKEDYCIKRYLYDPAGRMTSFIEHESGINEKGPEARLTEITYDPLGRLHQKKVWFDSGLQDYALECFKYDLAGNVAEKRIEDAQGAFLLRKRFSYNPQGLCIEEYNDENDQKTSLIKTTYNCEGEPISYFDGSGQETKIIINRSHHNILGQSVLKKTLVNPTGVQTEIEFDALNRIYSISKKDAMGVLLSSQKNIYDALGNLACEVHDQIVDGEILSSQKNQWIYGPMGRLEEEVEAADSSLEKRTDYRYNSFGKMSEKTIQGIKTPITYTYNKAGKLHKIEAKGERKELQISNAYLYDNKGNIVSASTAQGKTIQRKYNVFGQVIKETIVDGEGTYILQYSYDRKGRLKEIELPDKSKIAYAHDAVFGREVNRISAQGNLLYTHTYEQYDSQGKLLKENYIGYAGTNEYTYDLNGQKITNKNDFFSQQYTRDALGRILEVKGSEHEEYSYNALSQLVSEKKANTKTYAYDSLDNRIKVDNEELFYNTLNQLITRSQSEFSYDPQGNLLRKVLNGEGTLFENNILSQVISIEKSDKSTLEFSYDPFGRLFTEKHLSAKDKKLLSISRYFYLGHQEIGTLTAKGDIETLKIPGLQGDKLSLSSIAFEIKGEVYVPIHDIAGNVVSLVDPQSRDLIERYQYTAFGEKTIFNAYGEVEENSAVNNPWFFAEKRSDQKSGFILFGLRFYDPTIGRWINQDPAGLVDGPNLYAYLHNNPLNNFDGFGLATETNSQNKFDEYFYGEFETHCYCEKHRTCKRGGDIGKTSSYHLPKIKYCDQFEELYTTYKSEEDFWATADLYDEFRPYYERSRGYDLSDLGLPELVDMEIGFINGMNTSFESARNSAIYISKLSGGHNVHAVYNATHGIAVDLIECHMGLTNRATEPVRQLHKMWNSFFERSSSNAQYLMVCFSQGVIHVRNSLLDYPPELRERMIVVAIAPGGYIYQKCCSQVLHVRAKKHRDPIPRLDQRGSQRANETIVELDSHPNASFFDHSFTSPTYESELIIRISKYIATQGKKI